MSRFVNDAREEFFAFITAFANSYTNLPRLYKTLKHGQYQFRPREEFFQFYAAMFQQHMAHVDVYDTIATQWQFVVYAHPMISVGIQHYDALKICRRLADIYDKDFNLDTFSKYKECSLEEGETDDELFDALLKMRSNSYFEDAFAFVRVDFV